MKAGVRKEEWRTADRVTDGQGQLMEPNVKVVQYKCRAPDHHPSLTSHRPGLKGSAANMLVPDTSALLQRSPVQKGQ